jgi:hypothetical protein
MCQVRRAVRTACRHCLHTCIGRALHDLPCCAHAAAAQGHTLLPATLTSSACLPIPLGFRTRLPVSRPTHGIAAGWISLQPRPVSYLVRPLRPHLHGPLTSVPLLVLLIPLLPWTVWIAHMPLPPLSSWVLPLRPHGCCLSIPFPVVVRR